MSGTPPPFGGPVPGNRWDLAPAGHPMDPPRVSVVVAHYEQPTQLARCLRSLGRQRWRGRPWESLQVVVADDGSPRPPRVPEGVQLVRQEDLGFRVAAARNLGAAESSGDVLVFLDADTAPEPDCLERLTRLPTLVPETVVVGRRRHADFSHAAESAQVDILGPDHEMPEPAWLRQAYSASRDLLDADALSFRFVLGAVMACSRWWFETVGGFDESFTSYGGEDWEWAHRSWEAGGLVAHDPRAVVWHDGPDAGLAPRAWGGTESDLQRLHETLAVAATVPVPGVASRGLLGPRDDVVVTLAPEMVGPGLVASVDHLLEVLPRARVRLDAQQGVLVPDDPRVITADPPRSDQRWRRHLRLHAPVVGGRGAWRRLVKRLDVADCPGSVVVHQDGRVLVEVQSRRALLRAERWARTDLHEVHTLTATQAGLRELAVPSLASWFGGWTEHTQG